MGRTLNNKERQRLQQYLLAHPKCPAKATARLLGVARSTILEHKKLLGINPQREKHEADKGAYLPCPETIKAMCAEFRTKRKFPEDQPDPYELTVYGGYSVGRAVIFQAHG